VAEFIEVPVVGASALVVEAEESAPGVVPAGRLHDVTGAATETFDRAMIRLRGAAANAVQHMRQMVDPPDEVTVQFAVKLATQAGVVIANTSAEANLSVTLKWTNATYPPGPDLPVPESGPTTQDGDRPSS
jgi:hypothetical protein